MVPASMPCRPAMLMSVVVLPQPEGPSRVRNLPRGMLNEISFTAISLPNNLTRPCTSTQRSECSAICMTLPSRRQRLAAGDTPKDNDAKEQHHRLRDRQRRGQRFVLEVDQIVDADR